jgi:putative PIG3 family NAD(P)H quinone oxidoreductase
MLCAVIERHGKEIENLVFREREAPVARGENIRVRVTATAINRADLLQRRGLYPAPPGAPQDIPGLEFAGYVDQVGEEVTEWKGAEPVFGIVAGGSYAEQIVLHQRLAVRVPEGMGAAQAAAIPEAFLSAHDALITQGGMKAGDLVLIHAVAGGVGSAALQLAHRWGAKAIGTAGSAEKLERVAELAPLTAINYRTEDFQERIQSEFGPNAVDLILDTVGADYWQKNLAVLKTCGRLILFGVMSGLSAETPLATVLTKRLRILGTTLRSRPLEEKILAARAFAHQVVPLIAQGRLVPVIDSVFPFEKLHEATARMERNENTGKIVLTLA